MRTKNCTRQITYSVKRFGFYGGSITGVRPRELYAWINEHHDGISIALSCQALGVRREGILRMEASAHADRPRCTVGIGPEKARKEHPCYGVRGLRETVETCD